MHLFALVIAALAGALVAVQAPINSTLGKTTGAMAATFVSFVVGVVAAMVIAASSGQLSGATKALSVPAWQLMGGVFGACFIALAIALVPKIGVLQFSAAAVLGQVVMAIVVDHFGWLGMPAHHISWQRFLAVPLIAVALWLSRK